ncbi:MAG: 50S ribosomal protein L9 [Candidatus Omnitrophota bacterium]
MIKLILKENVKGIGKVGQVIEAKDGYARNYLLPKNLALKATDFNIKQVEKEKEKKIKTLEKEKDLSLQLAEKIKNISCTIAVEAQPDDTLYGAINAQEIEKILKEEGFNIDKTQIMLEEPIKKIGVFQVPIKLHPEVTSSVKIWVVKK